MQRRRWRLIQLRLAVPTEAALITGVKRDTALVQQVPFESPAQVSILDISLEKNRAASDKLLAAGVGETAEWLRSRYGQWLGCPGNG
jgi:hypothetical protein